MQPRKQQQDATPRPTGNRFFTPATLNGSKCFVSGRMPTIFGVLACQLWR